MLRVCLFVCMILLPILVKADGVTFTNASTAITLPAGFAPMANSPQNMWKYSTNADGAGFRVMPAMGTLNADSAGHYGIFWAALLNDTPFTGQIAFTTTATACYGGECAPVAFSGALGYSPNGLTWTLPIQAQTVALGGALIQFWDASNQPRGVVQTVDGAVRVRVVGVTETPEPASLGLLGLGLLAIARRLRKKTQDFN